MEQNIVAAKRIGNNFNKMTYGNEKGLSRMKYPGRCHKAVPHMKTLVVVEKSVIGVPSPIKYINYNRF